MKVCILCDSISHPVIPYLKEWQERRKSDVDIEVVHDKEGLKGGDLLILVSCGQIITREYRDRFRRSLVIHASDLPLGRGWSPHIWQVLEGKKEITVSLLEAEDKVDTGRICHQLNIKIENTDLYDDINRKLFDIEIKLMDYAVDNFNSLEFYEQKRDVRPTYYPKRTPLDSELDINKTLKEQFDLLRVCDPERFPAFFIIDGKKIKVKLERYESD